MFELMYELAAILRERRFKRGSIDFDFAESKITLDEKGKPLDVQIYERNNAHRIIEEFMLAANQTVAEEYYWQELPFVYRTHEMPDSEKIQQLSAFVANFGYTIKMNADEEIHPKEIQKLMKKVDGTAEEALISRLALRSMKQAKYTVGCEGHFGLAMKYYCHFTSPIRRYPDLQIHRIIKENLHGGIAEKRIKHYSSILPQVAEQSSEMERRADEAERDTEKLKKTEYMSKRIGERFTGVISGMSTYGIYVELPNTVEGMIHVNSLTDDYYYYKEETYEMVGEQKHRVFKLGQTMDIIVDEKQNSIVMRSCLEKNVPDIMRPKVYEWINEMQNKWYFVRMYLNQEGELMADYKITLKRAEASLVFQENVIEVVKSVVHVTLQYASAAFKIIHDSNDIGTKLTVKQVNLNPFEGGSCYGI